MASPSCSLSSSTSPLLALCFGVVVSRRAVGLNALISSRDGKVELGDDLIKDRLIKGVIRLGLLVIIGSAFTDLTLLVVSEGDVSGVVETLSLNLVVVLVCIGFDIFVVVRVAGDVVRGSDAKGSDAVCRPDLEGIGETDEWTAVSICESLRLDLLDVTFDVRPLVGSNPGLPFSWAPVSGLVCWFEVSF